MTGAQAKMVAALIAGLKADEALKALLGDPVRVWDQPPREPTYPHVLIGACETRAIRADAEVVEHLIRLTCVSRFQGMEEARAVAAAIEAGLGSLNLEDGRLVSCAVQQVEVSRTADLSGAFASMRLRAVVDLE